MAADLLREFVKEALTAGRDPKDIEKVLLDAGWSDKEVAGALSHFAPSSFGLPVPRPRTLLTARDVTVYAVFFITLIWAATSAVFLMHDLIDIWLPSAERRWNWNNWEWEAAGLIIMGPTYLLIARRERKRMASDAATSRSGPRRWALYLALGYAFLCMLSALVTAVAKFLEGDITLAFILKVLSVLLVAGVVWAIYRKDPALVGD